MKQESNFQENWRKAILPVTASLQDAARSLTNSALRICLILDSNEQLLGIVTDGDIRRGLLRGVLMSDDVSTVLQRNPLVAPSSMPKELVRRLIAANNVLVIPVVDEEKKVTGLYTWDEFDASTLNETILVIMAGGKGTRLLPHTENCPKPMVPINGKPMLFHIISKAKLEGIRRFIVAVHHLGHMIEDYFGDGSEFDIQIDYIREDRPLGTAGALSLMSFVPGGPILVSNGDVITDIRYTDLVNFHIRQSATATMAVRLHEWQHPFGVVQINGLEIIGFEEKPLNRSHINAGVYALSPLALNYLEKNKPCDMPKLFDRLKQNKMKILAYPMHEPWLDVGNPGDLSRISSMKDLIRKR